MIMAAMKVTAKFRLKNGIPFSIETLSGIIFRCGICGSIFYNRKDLEKHLNKETIGDNNELKFPELNKNIIISAIYSQGLRDVTNSKYARLKNGDKLLKQITRSCK